MAGHEWEDWFEREEFIGQISDIRVQNLQVEREMVQKRTFTRWMNLHLEKCNPPMEVKDLFRDIQDGRILMALLEELSGCRLLHAFKPSAHRIFRLNNIAKVLTFLEERNVKLVSIDAADIADGNSSIVLGLIWNIILFFQIKELTGNIKNQFSSSSSLSSIPTSSDSDTSHSSTPSDERRPSIAARDHGKAIKTLLHWVQRRTRKYGVAVQDFGKSWSSGLAFLAVIKSIDPSLVDMRRAFVRSSRENIEDAFRTAHYSLGIPRLLEPEDVTLNPPDEQSIMTYVSQFLEHFPGIEEDESSSEFLERSKVSARMNEPPVRNGVQRKREKSYVVKRDWVQPPPKIFISSVTEEHAQSQAPAQPQTPEDRPWTSEESSVETSRSVTAENQPQCRPLGLNRDTASASTSPQASLIDSAMDSPDSWGEMPSETAPQLQQSCSNGSLSDLRYSTSAGDLTSDQGSPLLSERASKDQADGDLFIDEGNFSLSSIDSLQAKSALLSEEEDAYRYILDLKEDGSADVELGEDTVNDPNSQQSENSPVKSPDVVKPADQDHPSYGDADSGYYPVNAKDTSLSISELDDISKTSLITDIDELISVMESQSELCEESLESSISKDLQETPLEANPNPLDFLEDDPECPIVKYERVSISGSEDEAEMEFPEGIPHDKEAKEEDLPDVFQSEDIKMCREELSHLRETQEADQVLHQEEPAVKPEEDKTNPDLVCTEISEQPRRPSGAEAEIQSEEEEEKEKNKKKASGSQESGMCEEPEMKDLRDAKPQASNNLSETNFIEVAKVEEEERNCTSSLESRESEEKLGEKRLEANQGDLSPPKEEITNCLECEPSETRTSMHEDATIDDNSKLEDLPSEIENVTEEELLSCNQQELETKMEEDQQSKLVEAVKEEEVEKEVKEDLKIKLNDHLIETESVQDPETHSNRNHNPPALDYASVELRSESDVQNSEIPPNDVFLSNANEVLNEPNSDPTFSEEIEHPFTPPTPSSPASQPDWDQATVEQSSDRCSQGQASWEEMENTIDTSERAERFPTELRLSLSVTPLQPAPSQSSHAGCDGERAILEKAGEGSVESPEQSPFELWSRHPGEWGAADSDLHADHCELISSDEELPAGTDATATTTTTTTTATTAAAARENMEPLREEDASDAAKDETRPSTDLDKAVPPKESKTESGINIVATGTAITNKRKPSVSTGSPESSSEVALSEMDLLLLLWLLLYCLFVLPQIDIWALPSLLLNLEE
ncbi:calmin [Astyanax mexicanus]|uniref:calmin n=1 Tax=Astyanax mexicanus TaxID=7994 RepID=UPI0020CAA6D3|nr:calmin [Astyanax mexicanus]